MFLHHDGLIDDTQADRAEAQLRAGVYGRLSETYDAAESVPTQLDRGTDHAARRGWTVMATFKDDGYSAFKEITRDGVRGADRGDRGGPGRRGHRPRHRPADPEPDRLERLREGVRAARRAVVRLYRRGPGPVHRRRRLLRRDGNTAGAAGKRRQERPRPRSPGPRG